MSANAGEVVRDTRRAERFWNWVGAVPHWIYPTVLRQFPRTWHHVVVWLSIPGVLLASTGVVLGIWQLFLNRSRWIPYRKFWMRWHHILGLAAAVFTVTWMLSGLLSMNPFGVFNTRSALADEKRQWEGGTGQPSMSMAAALQVVQLHGKAIRELRPLNVQGQAWYRLSGVDQRWWLRAADTAAPRLFDRLPNALVIQALQGLRPSPPSSVEQLDAYDSQYYARRPSDPESRWQRPLPVWRAQWDDGVAIYADSGVGQLLLRVDDSGRWERILYYGLHSLDFAPLLASPRLRDLLVIGLSILGLLMCATAWVLAWRVVKPKR